MSDHPMLLQTGQYAFETVPGTLVVATKKFSSLDLKPGPKADRYGIYGTGDQYMRGSGTNSEWTEIALKGTPTFDEIVPLLTLFGGAPTITTPAGGTNSRQHEWKGVNGVIPAVKSLSYEFGDANRGNRMAYVHGDSLTIGLARSGEGFNVGGSLFGQPMVDPFTLTAGATALPVIPIEGVKADTYVDTTFAGIGVTKLLRAATGTFSLSGMLSRFFALNSAQTGFATVIPARPDASANIRLGADDIGRPLALSYRTNDKKFVRFEVKNGTLIDVGITPSEYRFTLDMCLQVMEPGDFDDETGLMVMEPTMALIHDATAGFAWRIQAVNTQLAI